MDQNIPAKDKIEISAGQRATQKIDPLPLNPSRKCRVKFDQSAVEFAVMAQKIAVTARKLPSDLGSAKRAQRGLRQGLAGDIGRQDAVFKPAFTAQVFEEDGDGDRLLPVEQPALQTRSLLPAGLIFTSVTNSFSCSGCLKKRVVFILNESYTRLKI